MQQWVILENSHAFAARAPSTTCCMVRRGHSWAEQAGGELSGPEFPCARSLGPGCLGKDLWGYALVGACGLVEGAKVPSGSVLYTRCAAPWELHRSKRVL